MLAWFEVHRLLGVDRVQLYTYKLNERTEKVLQYYSSMGLADTVPFTLPKACKCIVYMFCWIVLVEHRFKRLVIILSVYPYHVCEWHRSGVSEMATSPLEAIIEDICCQTPPQ